MSRMDSVVRLLTVTTAAGSPLNQLREGSFSDQRWLMSAMSPSRTTRPLASARRIMSSKAPASYCRKRPRMMTSSLAVLRRPPVVSRLALRTAAATSATVRLSSFKSLCRRRTSISSSGKPLSRTCEMPSTARSSSSMRRASSLRSFKSSTPMTAKEIATPTASCLNTMGGSMPTGKLAMRSTAFLTFCSASSVTSAETVSMVMLPAFSLQTDLT